MTTHTSPLNSPQLSFNDLHNYAGLPPTRWPQLIRCEVLNLASNKLTTFGSIPWMPSLKTLDVSGNEIKSIPSRSSGEGGASESGAPGVRLGVGCPLSPVGGAVAVLRCPPPGHPAHGW